MFVAPFVSNSLTPLIAGSPSGGGGGGSPPVNTALPTITWSGNDWTVTPGTWTGADSVSTAVTLDGNTVGLTGTITAADDGDTLLVTETATNDYGSPTVTVSEVVSYEAPGHPLASYAGIGAGQMPIIADMLWPGSYSTDGSNTAVMSVDNLGGTGAYHGLTADGVATAPRLNGDAMLFRPGDLIRMANDAGLSDVHILLEAYIIRPGYNGLQIIAGHQGGGSAGVIAQIEYDRGPSYNRLRLNRPSVSHAAYAGGLPVSQWVVAEMRYSSSSETVSIAWNGTVVGTNLSVPGGGDLYINMFGSTMKYQRLGAVVSVVTDSGYSISNPEPAVIAARNYLIGRRA